MTWQIFKKPWLFIFFLKVIDSNKPTSHVPNTVVFQWCLYNTIFLCLCCSRQLLQLFLLLYSNPLLDVRLILCFWTFSEWYSPEWPWSQSRLAPHWGSSPQWALCVWCCSINMKKYLCKKIAMKNLHFCQQLMVPQVVLAQVFQSLWCEMKIE